jgi:uncharacterized protein with PQ loop repeat
MLNLHHLHLRKHASEPLAPYPHPNKKYRVLDRLVYVSAIAGPIMTLPQIYTIWIDKNTGGISVIAWATYLVNSFIWLFYGLVHKDKPIILTNSLWVMLNILIVAGIIMY